MKEHQCTEIKHQNSQDTSTRISCFNENWVFHKIIFACDQCVYDGEAQYEGEMLSVYDLSINYCPYCGANLYEKMPRPLKIIKVAEDSSSHKCSHLETYNHKFPRSGFSFDTDVEWKISKNIEEGWWSLEKYSTATEKMLNEESAEKGELVFWGGIGIDFCPFCGQKL